MPHKRPSSFFRLSFLIVCVCWALAGWTHAETYKGTVTPMNDRNYFPTLMPLIKNAAGPIRVMMYSANHYPEYKDSPSNKILAALRNAAGRNLSVEVILNRKDTGKAAGQEGPENQAAADYLAEGGVAVFFGPARKKLHTKLVLIDNRYVVIGSANWSYSALTKNRETVVLIDSPELAAYYAEYFEQVKKESKKAGKTHKKDIEESPAR